MILSGCCQILTCLRVFHVNLCVLLVAQALSLFLFLLDSVENI